MENGKHNPDEQSQLALEALLGALEGEDRLFADKALRQFAEDDSLLRETSETMADLAMMAPPVPAPEGVKRKLMASISKPRQQRAWLAPLGYAAAALLAVSTGILLNQQGNLDDALAALRAQNADLQRSIGAHQRALGIVSQSNVKEVILDTKEENRPRLRAYWTDAQGLVLLASNLTPLPENRVLQLWVIPTAGNPVSAGTFRPAEDGTVLYFHQPGTAISSSQALAITNEPAPGSAQPTSTPIWVGGL